MLFPEWFVFRHFRGQILLISLLRKGPDCQPKTGAANCPDNGRNQQHSKGECCIALAIYEKGHDDEHWDAPGKDTVQQDEVGSAFLPSGFPFANITWSLRIHDQDSCVVILLFQLSVAANNRTKCGR